MSGLILYIHLAVIAIVSAMFLNAFKNDWLKMLFGFTEISALLTAFGYAIWSIAIG